MKSRRGAGETSWKTAASLPMPSNNEARSWGGAKLNSEANPACEPANDDSKKVQVRLGGGDPSLDCVVDGELCRSRVSRRHAHPVPGRASDGSCGRLQGRVLLARGG